MPSEIEEIKRLIGELRDILLGIKEFLINGMDAFDRIDSKLHKMEQFKNIDNFFSPFFKRINKEFLLNVFTLERVYKTNVLLASGVVRHLLATLISIASKEGYFDTDVNSMWTTKKVKDVVALIKNVSTPETEKHAEVLIKFPEEYAARYNKLLDKLMDLVVLNNKLEDELNRWLGKRFRKQIKVGNQKINLTIVFDINMKKIYTSKVPEMRLEQIHEFLQSFSSLGSTDAVFSNAFTFLEKWAEHCFKSNYYNIFFEHRDVDVMIYIVETEERLHGRGFISKIFQFRKRKGKGVPVKVDHEEGRFRIMMSISMLTDILGMNEIRAYRRMTDFVVHEIGHLRDKLVFKNSKLLSRLRKEGVASLAELIAKLSEGRYEEKILNVFKKGDFYMRSPVKDLEQLEEIDSKNENDIYFIGLFMCFVIIGTQMNKKFGGFDREEFGKASYSAPRMELLKVYLKLLSRMPYGMFFKKYEEASKELRINTVLSKELIEEGKEL